MAKDLNATDIVSVGTLDKIATRTRKEIASAAKSKHAPLTSNRLAKNVYDPRLIHKSAPKVTKNHISINLSFTTVAIAFDKGGKPHSIDAKKKPYLVFDGTNGYTGQVIVTKHVDHPGVPARPFIQTGRDKARAQNKKDIADEAGKNIRLRVNAMKRVV